MHLYIRANVSIKINLVIYFPFTYFFLYCIKLSVPASYFSFYAFYAFYLKFRVEKLILRTTTDS